MRSLKLLNSWFDINSCLPSKIADFEVSEPAKSWFDINSCLPSKIVDFEVFETPKHLIWYSNHGLTPLQKSNFATLSKQYLYSLERLVNYISKLPQNIIIDIKQAFSFSKHLFYKAQHWVLQKGNWWWIWSKIGIF